MNFKKGLLTGIAAMAFAIVVATFGTAIEADAAVVTKQQQILFIKEHLQTALEKEEEYGIPHEIALAQGAWESQYGTSEFARCYHNLTGYACYPDSAGGPVVCHANGQFSSYEECWDAYYKLLAEKYHKANAYMGAPKQLAYAIAGTYNPGSSSYAGNICKMIDRVSSLEGEIVANQKAEAEAAAAAKAAEAAKKERILTALGEQEILVKDSAKNCLTAGATSEMAEMLSLKRLTVKEAADELLVGRLNFEDIGEYSKKVSRYIYLSI